MGSSIMPVLGQITLTQNTSIPKVGTEYTYYAVNSEDGADFRKSGANQTWDLSKVSGSSQKREYNDASKGSAKSSALTSADFVEAGASAGAENYYVTTSTGLSTKGHYLAGILEVVYTDLRESLAFPMGYEDGFNETFGGTVTNIQTAQSFNRSGTITTKADGHGRLILPYDTIENVLRILSVYEYEDKFLNTKVGEYVDTIILWHNAATKVQIASFSNNFSNGFKGITNISYLSEDDLVKVTVGAEINESPQFSLFPNPAMNIISLSTQSHESINSIAIFDLQGKALKTWSKTPIGPLDIGDLKNGLYLIRIESERGTAFQRLTKN